MAESLLGYAVTGVGTAIVIIQGLALHIQKRTEKTIDDLAERVAAMEKLCVSMRCWVCGMPWDGDERRKKHHDR